MTRGPAVAAFVDALGRGAPLGRLLRPTTRADLALVLRAARALTWAHRTIRGPALGQLLVRAMEPPARPTGASGDAGDALARAGSADRIGRAVHRAARLVPRQTPCLERSMATWLLLSSEGVPARVRIGVSTTGRLTAHSWVETDSGPVGEDAASLERFRAFELPTAGAEAPPGAGVRAVRSAGCIVRTAEPTRSEGA